MVDKYHNKHLRKNDFRGKFLYNILKPYLINGDKILDVGCGYAPIGKVINDKYNYIGIDIDKKCINTLNKDLNLMVKSNVNIINIDINNVNTEEINVLLLLGTIWIHNDKKSLKQFIQKYKPRVVLLEGFASNVVPNKNEYLKGTRNWYWIRSFNACLEVLYSFNYEIKKGSKYINTDSTMGSDRVFLIFETFSKKIVTNNK